ncbi:low molecular weight protein-tyrosine-phosphatase [Microbacterium mangrovi]|uniref:low molecular weight protein-tyrosine-phosphatase n=1 Tax=Microbacterium mangrovi TaxID=1348253 RepID=UPI00068ABFED|nr:low molecular weight protein-tyrosine-phosphatase [Microbacterium mangrovi]
MSTPGDSTFRVEFVCTGNICRSPMAEVVFRSLAESVGLGDRVASTSAGTGDWHVGERADPRTIEALARRGYNGATHRARQFDPADFAANDLIIALDSTHARVLHALAPTEADAAKVHLLSAFDPDAVGPDVPDPYYAGPEMFDDVLGMIEGACRSLFRQLEPALRTTTRHSPPADADPIGDP